MDGLLVVDKPAGLTSHEVVACARRAFDERRIGHTGTLDPAATGILALVLGRATRLARFLSSQEKVYDAVVRLGFSTDSYDADGTPVGPVHSGATADLNEIDRALDVFRGSFLQTPPAFSAKKIDGARSYRIARRARHEAAGMALLNPPTLPAPASVTAHAIDLVGATGDRVTLRITCSAGFYVRSLAHDLGQQLGTGAHLFSLRRLRSGGLSLDDAVSVELLATDPPRARERLVPLAGMLPELPAVTLTSEGVVRAVHGRELGPGDMAPTTANAGDAGNPGGAGSAGGTVAAFVRLLDSAGDLVGIASPEAPQDFCIPLLF